MTAPIKKSIYIASSILLGIFVFCYIYRLLFPKTLGDDAREALVAGWRADGFQLYDFVYPSEIKALDLTPAKLDDFLKKLVKPNYDACKRFRVEGVNIAVGEEAPTQGICSATVDLPSGHNAGVDCVVEPTDQGSRTSAIGMLLHSWFIRYHVEHPDAPWTQDTELQSQLDGYNRNKQLLTDMNIVGVVYHENDGRDRLVSWSEWVVRVQKLKTRLQQFEQSHI